MNKEPTTGELAIMLKNISDKIDDFHIDQKLVIVDVKRNTEFRIQSSTIIGVVKWLGAGQIITMAYLALEFLAK